MESVGYAKFNVISLPNPEGGLSRYKIVESPIGTPAIMASAKVKTYKVIGLDDQVATGRLDWGGNGFHGYIQSSKGDIVIDPPALGDRTKAVAYYRKDSFYPKNGFICNTVPAPNTNLGAQRLGGNALPFSAAVGTTLKTYRLAMNATIEYTAFYGNVTNAQNGVITSMNRVNQVYERDLAIRMTLVRNNPYTGSDPFDNNNGSAMLGQNQTVCDATPGNANYDIGHVFSTGGGGIATLNSVGVSGIKARGVTGQPSPIGDPFDIDYVAHEMGHQFGGNHTFANCPGGSAPAATRYEPGSGSTIQAYAGICGATNLQSNSDAYFHLINLLEMESWRESPSSGGTAVPNGNILPTVNAGANYTIPLNTPFKLTATGSDGNGDTLTYCWEIWETGNTTTGATHRSFNPTTNPTRFVPAFPNVLSGSTSQWDPYMTVARTARWRVTARDNRAGGGGFANDEMSLTVSGAQFSVTSPNTAVNLPGGSAQTVTWNVGGGSVAPNVRILLSTDGGNSYANGTATVLVASTANDGSESVTLPNINTTQARIIVEAVGNIFYDISNVNFTITAATLPTISAISPTNVMANSGNFLLTVTGTNFVNGTSTIRWNGSNRTTNFVNSTTLTTTIPNSDIANIGNVPITVANGASISNAINIQVRGIVVPNAFALISGFFVSGNLAALQTSDDVRYNAFPNFAGARTDPNIVVEGTFPAPVASPQELQFKAEVNATAGPNDLKLQGFNYVSGLWEDLGAMTTTSTTDTVVIRTVTSSTSRFISGGQMKMRVWIRAQGTNGARNWQGQIDQMFIQIHP